MSYLKPVRMYAVGAELGYTRLWEVAWDVAHNRTTWRQSRYLPGPMAGSGGFVSSFREESEVSRSFGPELRRLRTGQGWSLRQLASKVNYAFGYLSKIENGVKPPTADLAERCDQVFGTGTRLTELTIAQSRNSSRGVRFTRPAQLPSSVADFVGREDTLKVLCAVADSQSEPGAVRVVTLEGAPGAGKTALAVRGAHLISHRFPDGQLFVNLRGYDSDGPRAEPGDVLEDFLRSVGVPPASIPCGVDKRAALFRSVLDGKQVLLVLDNAATSEQVRPLLPSSEGSMVVVTARNRLSGLAIETGATRVTLRGLSPSESLGLFRRVVGTKRVDTELSAAQILAERCAHLPLALRVAAEHIAVRQHHSLGDLAADLALESTRLDVLASRDDVRTVRAVFSWSYRDLSNVDAQMFRRLSLHSGQEISVEAAAALDGCSPASAHQRLARLCSTHLLEEVDKDRYRLHDLLRVYAAELVRLHDDTTETHAAVHRLLAWYLHSAAAANDLLAPQRGLPDIGRPTEGVAPLEFAEGNYDRALSWCEREASNIVCAVEQARQHGLVSMSWKLAVVNWNYYYLRKRWNVWLGAHSRGLRAARDAGDRLGEAWCLQNLGVAYMELRQFDKAQEHLREAITIRRKVNDQWGLGWSLFALGITYSEMGRFDEACAQFHESIEFCRTRGFEYGVAGALCELGTAYRRLERYDEAVDCEERALSVFKRMGAVDGESFALVRLGAVYVSRGDYDTALEYLDQALILRRETGDRWGQAEVLLSRGHAFAGAGQRAAARDCWQEAVTIFGELSDPRAADARAQLATLDDEFEWP